MTDNGETPKKVIVLIPPEHGILTREKVLLMFGIPSLPSKETKKEPKKKIRECDIWRKLNRKR